MNQFGHLFKVNLYGASHQDVIGVMIDGVPVGLKIDAQEMEDFLARRKPTSKSETARREEDRPIIKCGLFNGLTDGTPLVIEFKNNDTHSSDYNEFVNHPRPSHVDLVAKDKYHGFNDYRGSGAFSGRLTAALCAAGYVAKKVANFDYSSEIVQCGDLEDLSKLDQYLEQVKSEGDSVGGVLKVVVKNVNKSLGEPYFYSAESAISQILFSIGSVKGVSFGAGFEGVGLKGSQFNDLIINKDGKTATNNAGGINGGITNGNDLVVNVFVRPISSIAKTQETYDFESDMIKPLTIKGRHDASIIKRVGVVLESAVAIALADLVLLNKVYF